MPPSTANEVTDSRDTVADEACLASPATMLATAAVTLFRFSKIWTIGNDAMIWRLLRAAGWLHGRVALLHACCMRHRGHMGG